MSFRSEIDTLLNNDASINSLVSDIYYAALPDNVSLSNEYIVWNARIEESYHVKDNKSWGDEYLLTIKIIGQDPSSNEYINKTVRDAVHGFRTNNIRTTFFEREIEVYDPDNDLFTSSSDYTCQYKNN